MPSVPKPPPANTSSTTTSGITEGTDGTRVIASSTRPDGSTRKEIKIRPGYRPPEDVEVYKNRSAQALQDRGKDWKDGVPGAVMVDDDDDDNEDGGAVNSKNAKKRAAKKRAKEAAVAAAEKEKEKEKEKEQKASLSSAKTKSAVDGLTEEEKEKQIKAIRKKIRQATDLKVKKDSGESLLPEQLEKVTRILELTRQLEALGVKE